MRWFALFITLLCANALLANLPLRDCTLSVSASGVPVPQERLKPYLRGNLVVLNARGFIFEPPAAKSIKAEPTDDISTPFRTAINYHRAIRTQGPEEIARYWHPSYRKQMQAYFSRPEILSGAKEKLSATDNIDSMGMLELDNRAVMYVRYGGRTQAFVCVKVGDEYLLVNDPGTKTLNQIACAAFDSGRVEMASN
ncbi:MAG: hypothetical protein AAFX93_05030 [Verrucomicrobiota bacterium]